MNSALPLGTFRSEYEDDYENEVVYHLYKQKQDGTRFVQMVSKKLPNGKFSWVRRVPFAKFVQVYRESGGKQNNGGMQMVNTFSIWKFFWEFWTTIREIPFSPEIFCLGRPK